MGFELHTYPDGTVGLAARCDVCGERIETDGFIVWNLDPDTHAVSDRD